MQMPLNNEVMKAQDGDVVLLHDIHEYNVDAVKRIRSRPDCGKVPVR